MPKQKRYGDRRGEDRRRETNLARIPENDLRKGERRQEDRREITFLISGNRAYEHAQHIAHAGLGDAPGSHLGTYIGLTMATLGVLLAFGSAKVGSERAQEVHNLVEQQHAHAKYQAQDIKHRVAFMAVAQVHAMAFGVSNPTVDKQSLLVMAQNVTRYLAESVLAKEWANSFDGIIKTHMEAQKDIELGLLYAEIGIVIASVALLLKRKDAWYVALLLGAATIFIMTKTMIHVGHEVHESSQVIARAEAKYEEARKAHKTTKTEKGYWRGEISNRAKSGEFEVERLTISCIKNEHDAIINHVCVFSNITHLIDQLHQLKHLANYDALTGLPNRLLLADRLKLAIAHTHRNSDTLAVCYLDLDGFKPVNDNFGHSAGDEVLRVIAQRLKKLVRGNDTVARLGGDEFVLLLGDQKKMGSYTDLLDRLLEEIALPIPIPNNSVKVTASIGVCLFPAEGIDPNSLLQCSDEAMYQAKRLGKGRYVTYATAGAGI